MAHTDVTGNAIDLTSAASPAAATALQEGLRLADAGDVAAAIAVLAEQNRRAPDTTIERTLVRLRTDGSATARATRVDRPAEAAAGPAGGHDRFAGTTGIPEVDAGALDADTIRAGVLGHGSLIVRGLVPPDAAAACAASIDEVFDGYDAVTRSGDPAAGLPWYEAFTSTGPVSWTLAERMWAQKLGGIVAADSPRGLAQVVDLYESVGLGAVIEDYLGERPALSVKKLTLRRTAPDVPTEWHQDGSFLGDGTRTLNVWLALSPCGVDAPSLDIVPQRFDTIVATGTDDSKFDWSVSRAMADRVSERPLIRPVFAPGDAVLFDQFTLHRTGLDEAMDRTRYAIESWFFAPSTYPHEQIAVAF